MVNARKLRWHKDGEGYASDDANLYLYKSPYTDILPWTLVVNREATAHFRTKADAQEFAEQIRKALW